MFASLNRFMSRLDGQPQPEHNGTEDAAGFQVLRNVNNDLKLEPWFDFIIGINGRNIDNPDPNLFAAEVRNCAGSTLSLGVWSAKGQTIREIFATVPKDPPSLGLSLQWMPLSSSNEVWHILEVTPNSPADAAGLLPYGDYIIGSLDGMMRGEGGLGELVEDHLERELRLLVYNQEYDVARMITITPSRNWHGQGALGCTLGYGALHRIPAPLNEPPPAPGETMFDASSPNPQEASSQAAPTQSVLNPTDEPQLSPSANFLVPASLKMSSPTSPNGPPASKRGKGRVHHSAAPVDDMDEYFREGEARSKEEDHVPKSKSPAAVPPPPKIGEGPPKG